jgi:hypothetical protein
MNMEHFPSRHSARPPSSLWVYSTASSRPGTHIQGPDDAEPWTEDRALLRAREIGRAYGNLTSNGYRKPYTDDYYNRNPYSDVANSRNPYNDVSSRLRDINELPELRNRVASTPSMGRQAFPNLNLRNQPPNRPYSQNITNSRITGAESGKRTPSWFKRSQTNVLAQMDERLLQSHVTTPSDDVTSNASLEDVTSFEELNAKTKTAASSNENQILNGTLRSLLMPSELDSYLDQRNRCRGRNGAFSKSMYVGKTLTSSSKGGPINRPHTVRPSMEDRRRQTMKRALTQPKAEENVFNQQNRTYELTDRVKTILRDGVLRKVDT